MSITAESLDRRLDLAVRLARAAGEAGLRYFRNRDALTIEAKGHQDLVSEADRALERLIRAGIAEAFPDDAVVGEEGAPTPGTSGFVWVLDPIDGTVNFLTGIPEWCVSIAVALEGVAVVGVIYDPSVDEMFSARKGGSAFLNGAPIRASSSDTLTRGSLGVGFSNRHETADVAALIAELFRRGGIFYRNGSGALMLAYTAAGRLLGYCEPHMNSWDCLAGFVLVEEAGGRVLAYDPATVVADGTRAVAAAPGVFAEVAALTAACFGR